MSSGIRVGKVIKNNNGTNYTVLAVMGNRALLHGGFDFVVIDELDYFDTSSVEDIIEKFSKILEDIPDSDETWYITDNLNLTREDKSQAKNPEKILRNARIDKDGNLVVKKADWTN
mgnify:CR=1 FL=1